MKLRDFVIVLAMLAAAGGWTRTAAGEEKVSAAEREQKLIAVLQSDAAPEEKAMTCKRLAVYGSKDAVPALAALLSNEQLASWARIALEAIPDPAADEALRQSMDKLQGRLLVGVINSIGVRRDAKATDGLAGRLKDADVEVASAAAEALGRIGGDQAAKAVESALAGVPAGVRAAVAEGCIFCAEKYLAEGKADEAVRLYDVIRKADVPRPRVREATRGAIVARGAAGLPLLFELLRSSDKDQFAVGLSTAREVGGAEVANALIEELGRIQPPPAQAASKTLIIKKALYGAGNQRVDVTDKLAAAISNNALTVEASNNLANDPAPGVVKELRITYSLGGEEKTAVVAENQTLQLGQGAVDDDPRQVGLIYTLGDVGQKSAMAAVLKIAQNGSWGARVAAARVLGRIGDASAVPALLDAAQSSGVLGQAAVESLAELQGEAVDQAIVAGLQGAQGQTRAILIQLVGSRAIQSAIPTLLKDATSSDESIRLAAIAALGMTVGFEQFDALIQRFIDAPNAPEAEVAKTALLTACTRMSDRNGAAEKLLAAMSGATAEEKASLLELLAALGGEKALQGVAAAARSGDSALQDAASRVLGEWMSADAAPVLLSLAESGSEKYRVRALRGYLRIARQLDVAGPQRMAMCREVSKLCKRDAEKKLILEVLRRYPSAEGLSMALPYLQSTALKSEAGRAAVVIGEKILSGNAPAVADAMKQVLDAGCDAEVTNRAKALLNQAAGAK
jgi:HEAT repeat protein